jgi:fibronectin type 3 domain-containing protein
VASVTVSAVSVDNAEFVISGLSFPVTIPAGQSVDFTVTFTPQTSGAVSANASFTSDASNSPTPATLTGTGVAQSVHTVNLSWNASTSQNVVGYNIYRRTGTGGSYAQINTILNPTTEYTDTSVADGLTYYYETTAVNSSDEESARSASVQAVIPPS